MADILLLDDDLETLATFEVQLRAAGHDTVAAARGADAIKLLSERPVDLTIADVCLPDISGLDVLRTIRGKGIDVPVVLVTGFGCIKDAVAAMRLGATDFVEKPVSNAELLRIVETSLRSAPTTRSQARERSAGDPEAHAIRRWANVVMPIVDSPRDLPTLGAWGRYVAASIGALRNWCRTARIGTRRSLVFGRLLRGAILIEEQGANSPENLLDVVDLRTISNLLKFAGLTDGLPMTSSSYLERQTLVRDTAALKEIGRALKRRSTHRCDA